MPAVVADERRRHLARDLHAAAIALLRRLRAVDAASGISPARLSLLSVLVFGGGSRTVGELAAIEQVRPSTMTRLVQSLAAEGWVTCTADPQDRRSVRVEATEAGRALLLAGRDRREERLLELLADVEGEQLATLEAASAVLLGLLRPAAGVEATPEGAVGPRGGRPGSPRGRRSAGT